MSKTGDELVKEGLKALAADFALLDGPGGDGVGGLVKKMGDEWMAKEAWLMRGYVTINWLKNYTVDGSTIEDVALRDKYLKMLEKAQYFAKGLPKLASALAKTPVDLNPQKSWYSDWGYWRCAVSVAATGASVGVGDYLGALGWGFEAYDSCSDYIDSLP